MAVFNFRVFSAQNLLNGSGDQVFNYNSTNAVGSLSGTFTTGTEDSFFISVDDTGDGTGNGSNFTGEETIFEDDTNVLQFLDSPATFTYEDQNGLVTTTEFSAGSQVQAELQQSFSNGYTIVAIRIDDPNLPGLVTVGYTFIGTPPPPGTVLGTPTTSNNSGDVDYASLACFTAGIRVETSTGMRPVEDIAVGDLVMTHDNGQQPVTWVGTTVVSALQMRLSPVLQPVTVPKGMFGAIRDVAFSRNHRVLVKGPQVELLHGNAEMLAAIGHFAHGVRANPVNDDLTYYHIACHDHQLIKAEGMLVETILVEPVGETMLEAEANPVHERHAVRPILKRWEVGVIEGAMSMHAAGSAAA
jgi:hypothetical protein